MVLLRHLLGDALRRLRLRQGRTLREVSASARVSLGYLSEVERGQKEASSELLAAICSALGAPLSQVMREVSDNFAFAELQSEPVFADVIEPGIEVAGKVHVNAGQAPAVQPAGAGAGAGTPDHEGQVPVASARMSGAVASKLRAAQVRGGQVQVGQVGQVGQKVALGAGPALPIGTGLDDPMFDQVARAARQITDMVPV
jgi:transcriptional regulator with XRE-family HTH domain